MTTIHRREPVEGCEHFIMTRARRLDVTRPDGRRRARGPWAWSCIGCGGDLPAPAVRLTP